MRRTLACLLLPLLALGVLSGCDRHPAGQENCLSLPTTSIAPPAGPVPETLATSGVRLTIRAELFRDFMPVSPPQGRPMFAVIRLSEVDSLAIPAGIVPDHLWALQPPRTWSTPLEDPGFPPDSTQIWREAGCGPLWDPGTFATVLVRVRTPQGDRFVRRDSVAITATY